jgi:hypothetical protein
LSFTEMKRNQYLCVAGNKGSQLYQVLDLVGELLQEGYVNNPHSHLRPQFSMPARQCVDAVLSCQGKKRFKVAAVTKPRIRIILHRLSDRNTVHDKCVAKIYPWEGMV